MPRIVDLSQPIETHFRWPVERSVKGDFTKGDAFEVTRVGLVVHGFTHVDAPRHMVPGGPTTSDTPLEQLCGEAAVVDLTGIADEQEIDAAFLAPRAGHVRAGDIVLLKTAWETRRAFHSAEFWTTAPYLSRDACEWLLAKRIKALGVDFPQDYPIRGLIGGKTATIAEFVSHDVLLRNGVILIEYLCNLGALASPRTTVYALPINLPGADGAPARVIAVEP